MEGDVQSALCALSNQIISIHTLRMVGDFHGLGGIVPCLAISIHTLRMEGDAGAGHR